MNDYQTIMAILDKAHIPYQRDISMDGRGRPEVPDGAIGLGILNLNQPHTDGPTTMDPNTELVFGPDRDLIAIWAWE